MRFKITAIAAACMALAPAAFAAGTDAPSATSSGMHRDSGQMTTGAHSSMSSEQVRQIQQALSDKGFDPGPVDGVMGPKTRQAMRNFKQSQGMTGSDMDAATLSALGVDATSSSGSGATNRGSGSGTTGAGGATGSRAGTPGTTGTETPPTTSTGSSTTPTTPGGSQLPSTSTGPMGSGSMGGTPSNTPNSNTRAPSTDSRGSTGTDSYGTSGEKRR